MNKNECEKAVFALDNRLYQRNNRIREHGIIMIFEKGEGSKNFLIPKNLITGPGYLVKLDKMKILPHSKTSFPDPVS